ncbi:putative uncharacterized protein DDB_G0286901, partial [Contarinia nasturtii]|uniref:putative uncharacterized protein DDB_G0286901 n=1 Tax=Contarinia nasturtii TaxID=265458 RepID=UPI0012D497AA
MTGRKERNANRISNARSRLRIVNRHGANQQPNNNIDENSHNDQVATTSHRPFLRNTTRNQQLNSNIDTNSNNEHVNNNSHPHNTRSIIRPITQHYGQRPIYAQLYFFDTDTANYSRMNNQNNERCLRSVMNKISEELDRVNPYVGSFRKMHEQIVQFPRKELSIVMKADRDLDLRRFNEPISTDVAVIFTSTDGEPPYERNMIAFHKVTNEVRKISILEPSLDPLAYPLLFPNGDKGWQNNIKHSDPNNRQNNNPNRRPNNRRPNNRRPNNRRRNNRRGNNRRPNNNPNRTGNNNNATINFRDKVTMSQYASYRLAIRNNFSLLHHSQKLFLQWIVDMYVRIESSRLHYLRQNQSTLRAEVYSNMVDHIHGNPQNVTTIGRSIILPSSFIGSPRNMYQNYLDAMVIVQTYGKPSTFITMTCNPNWSEIKDYLGHETSNFRPDIV